MWPLVPLAFWLFQVASPPDYSSQGLKAVEGQRYAEAVQSFEQAFKANPQDYFSAFYLGFSLSMLDRDEEAIAAYRKALVIQPNLPQAQLNLGTIFLRQKRAKEAMPLLDAAAAANPKEIKYRLALGEACLANLEFARAEAVYTGALELDPKSATAEAGLGRALARQNKLAEAEPHYRKAIDIDPTFSDSLLELASLYEEAKRFQEAIALYKQFPGNPAAQERAGELLLETNQAPEAISHLEAAVQKAPTVANQFALANAYTIGKQFGKAEALLSQAVKSEPANARLRMSYGRVLREQKQYDPAAREFYKAAQLQPESLAAWSDLAGMLILLEQDSQAIAALDKVRALGGEKAGHFYFRAILFDKHKDLKQALENYEKFLALSEGHTPDEEFKARQRVRIIKNTLSK